MMCFFKTSAMYANAYYYSWRDGVA